jgi:predicted RecA/RadA family phage recombinase
MLGPKTLLTNRGGFATAFRNGDTVKLLKGETVAISTDAENSVRLGNVADEVVGIAAEDVEVGQVGWFVTSGIAEVRKPRIGAVCVGDAIFQGDEDGTVRAAPSCRSGLGYCVAVKGEYLDVLLHFI